MLANAASPEQIHELERELRALGADHPYVPLLRTAPGIAWILAYTITEARMSA